MAIPQTFDELERLAAERDVVVIPTRSAALDIMRDGALLAHCADLREALSLVRQLYTPEERARYKATNGS